MGRGRVFIKPVGRDSVRFPAIRVEFRGENQIIYFDLMRIAKAKFEGVSQTELARMILRDWTLAVLSKEMPAQKIEQMVMDLRGGQAAMEKGNKRRKAQE